MGLQNNTQITIKEKQLMKNAKALRGGSGSYAMTHTGLETFWSCMIAEVAKLPSNIPDVKLLSVLDDWLMGLNNYLFLASQNPRSCTLLLARWVFSLIERNLAEIQFLPVSPCFGMAIEREVLQVLLGLFPTNNGVFYANPCNPTELRSAVSYAPYNVEPETANKKVLVIVDGIDRAADWQPHVSLPFLDEYESDDDDPKFVISLSADNPIKTVKDWQKRFSWNDFNNTVIQIPPDLYEHNKSVKDGLNPFSDKGNSSILNALSVTLAPVNAEELRIIFDIDLDLEKALIDLQKKFNRSLIIKSSGSYHFISDEARYKWTSMIGSEKCEKLESLIIEKGLHNLSMLKNGESSEIPEYLIQYLGAHMARQSASREDFMQLVSPKWLDFWMKYHNGLVGFIIDVRRARAVVEQDLLSSKDIKEHCSIIKDLLWCAVVEVTLLEKEGSYHIHKDALLNPYRAPTVDLKRSTGNWRERVELLMALAKMLDEPEQSKISQWVDSAKRNYYTDGGNYKELTHRYVPGWHDGPYLMSEFVHLAPIILSNIYDDSSEESLLLQTSPSSLVEKIGAKHLLDKARKSLQPTMPVLAELTPHLPEEMREKIVEEFMEMYWDDDEEEMSPSILACSQWMNKSDAIRILCMTLKQDRRHSFKEFLIGWDGLINLAAPIYRLGGQNAIVDTASVIVEVGEWLP